MKERAVNAEKPRWTSTGSDTFADLLVFYREVLGRVWDVFETHFALWAGCG
jgi:hypothetical protein